MADWGQTDQGGSSQWNTGGQDEWDTGKQDTNNFGNDGGFDNGGFANGDGFNSGGFENGDGAENGHANDNDKCFGCGETGHRRAECPNPQEMACRYCKQPGHMVKDCPDKPPMVCENCGEEGHMRKNCENARKINRDHIADVSLEEALNKIKQAVAERDVDDAKEGVQEYIKATNGEATYRDVQTALIEKDIGLWLIASEKPLLQVFANMDLQGNIGKKYTVSYRFTEKADRPREVEGWPKDRDELLSRLDDAGEVVDKGIPLCNNCKELGHISKYCTQEKAERTDAPKISCYNCGGEGHRVRDCPEPRVDKFACKNCGQSGHKASDCDEPPNPANVECRKCNEVGHFAKDCPQGGGRACRNCGEEGHMAKECDKPRDMSSVTCRNCDKPGHYSRECPEPKDWSKVQCSNCQQMGHTKVRCKEPPADEMDGGNFGDADNDAGWASAGGQTSGDHKIADDGWTVAPAASTADASVW
ncbi:hypothetical protein NW754_008962 [Fusarium falciforme]|uniref:CCHC-type domain-containing protein n=1 Tax=Fusarium falciforme TaxID=195108 RepID=A0A9W8V466_9HYPO|nr:hypothetical protein NW754_008962 [Fusarium falciforme]KAJ4191425.1 hypothetical protein NW755_004611 [Fusarium falciforme]KAJ4261153.1 hypothetical protein NW757_001541 [Fusarium falciforme]